MIDIKRAKEAFAKYVDAYDKTNSKVDLKYNHTLRVVDLCKNIALSLHLNDDDIDLAELLGLLHDVGRFEQIRVYNSFSDSKTVDHGDFGTYILFNDNKIRDFIETDEYDELIKKVVSCHNKNAITEGFTPEEELFAKIVRDADKIDILYLDSINRIRYKREDEIISREVIECILSKTSIDRRIARTGLDKVLLNLAFIYDLNFQYSYNIIRNNNYLALIIDNLDLEQEESKRVFDKLIDFINKDFDLIKEVI